MRSEKVELLRVEVVGLAVRRRVGAPQQRAQPGQQLLERERLGEVVVGAGVEPLDPVADRVAGGEHEDRQVVARRAERAGRLDAVEPRHHHVDHDRVGRDAADAGERLGAVAGERHLVAVELQRATQRVTDRPVVVDDEDAGAGGVGRGRSRPQGCHRHLSSG